MAYVRRARVVIVERGICYVPLSRGMVAICDELDYPIVSPYNWSAYKHELNFYATTQIWNSGEPRNVLMHRLILGIVDCRVRLDHVDGNGLNNCRSNLRIATHAENQRNLILRRGSSSGLKGVHWDYRVNGWVAQIQVMHNKKYLGIFDTKEAAANAYDTAALKYFGAFAKTNSSLGLVPVI